jgi:hypothetical protein
VHTLPRPPVDYIQVGDGGNHNAACEDYARIAHATTLRRFNLTAAQLPLLQLDLWNRRSPFSADKSPSRG